MITITDVEAKLSVKLPPFLRAQALRLAQLLVDVTKGVISRDELQSHIDTDAALIPVVNILAGQHIIIDGVIVVFEADGLSVKLQVGTVIYNGVNSTRYIHTDGGDYVEGNIDNRQGVFLSEGAIINGPVIGVNWGTITINSFPSIDLPSERYAPPEVHEFVGRDVELSKYKSQLAVSHIAIITGMAGVGKTTLAAMLAQQVGEQDRVFWYSFIEPDGFDVVINKLAAFLARHGQKELWQLLHTAGSRQTPSFLLDYVVPMVCGHDYVLCFDDLQHVQEDALFQQFVERIRGALQKGTISLILISQRTSKLKQMSGSLPLQGLRIDDTRNLLLNHRLDLPHDLIKELYDSVEGNAQLLMLAIPLLKQDLTRVEELIKHLPETQKIGDYLIEKLRSNFKPASDQDEAMKALSILLGEPGSRDLIEAILDRSGMWDVLDNLRNLSLLTSVDVQRETLESRYTESYVQHSVVRKFYYQKVLGNRERKELHRRAGAYYESEEVDALKATRHFVRAGEYHHAATIVVEGITPIIHQGQAQAVADLLAQLSVKKLETDLQILVWIARGDVATLLAEHAVAQQSYEAARVHISMLPDTTERHVRTAQIERRLSVVAEQQGLTDEAEAACRRGLQELTLVAPQHLERARLYVQLGEVFFRRSETDAAEHACDQGLESLPSEPAARSTHAEILQRLATIRGNKGAYEDAIIDLQQSLKVVDQSEDPILASKILHNLGVYLYYKGDFEPATIYCQESLRIKETIGDIVGRIVTNEMLGLIAVARGQFEKALHTLEECRAISEQFQLWPSLANALLNIGIVYYQQEQWAAARNYIVEAQTVYESLGEMDNRADCFYRLGDIAIAQGDVEGAVGYAQQSFTLAQQIQNDVYQACALRVLAEAQLYQGHLDDAVQTLIDASTKQEHVNDPSDQILLLRTQALVANGLLQKIEAVRYAQEGLDLARKQQMPYLITKMERTLHEIRSA